MSIKLERHDPKPQPLPPPTYSLEGLSEAEIYMLHDAVACRLKVGNSFGYPALTFERNRLERILRVLGAIKP